jgi:hypothetical protein
MDQLRQRLGPALSRLPTDSTSFRNPLSTPIPLSRPTSTTMPIPPTSPPISPSATSIYSTSQGILGADNLSIPSSRGDEGPPVTSVLPPDRVFTGSFPVPAPLMPRALRNRPLEGTGSVLMVEEIDLTNPDGIPRRTWIQTTVPAVVAASGGLTQPISTPLASPSSTSSAISSSSRMMPAPVVPTRPTSTTIPVDLKRPLPIPSTSLPIAPTVASIDSTSQGIDNPGDEDETKSHSPNHEHVSALINYTTILLQKPDACHCGHLFDGRNPELDLYHRSHVFAPSVDALTEPLLFDMAGKLMAELEGHRDLQQLVILAMDRETLNEYNAKMALLVPEWKETMQRVWCEAELKTGQEAGAVHEKNAASRYILSAGNTHMQDLMNSREGITGVIDLRLDKEARHDVAGLVMSMRVATRTYLNPINEIELSCCFMGAPMQNSHVDCDATCSFRNYLMDVSPPACCSHGYSTLVANQCGMPGGGDVPPPLMSMYQRQQRDAILDDDQMKRPYVNVSAGQPAGDHPAQWFDASFPHRGPGFNGPLGLPVDPWPYDSRERKSSTIPPRASGSLDGVVYRMILFASEYDACRKRGIDECCTTTDSRVLYSTVGPRRSTRTDNPTTRMKAREPDVWIDELSEVEERSDRHQRNAKRRSSPDPSYHSSLPLVPASAYVNEAAKDHTGLMWRLADAPEAHDSHVHFREEAPWGFHKRGRLYRGNLIITVGPNGSVVLRIRFDWSIEDTQLHMLTTMGGDAVESVVSFETGFSRLRITSSMPDAPAYARWVGDLMAPGQLAYGARCGDVLQNCTVYERGLAASLTVVDPLMNGEPDQLAGGQALHQRILHEGCGYLARTVDWKEANTRYHVWYHDVVDPPIPPVVILKLKKSECAFTEITRPSKLFNPNTTISFPRQWDREQSS